jgi:hypothetical protein
MKISEELQDGWGYPQVTENDWANILGKNFAKLMKIDTSNIPINKRSK